jgi:hypothetical protein
MLLGVSYQVDNRLIQIFEAEGMIDQHGQWLRSYGEGPEEEVSPCSCTMDQIDSCITEIVESGQSDKIAQLQLGAHEAVTLFLEGILTMNHFSRAYEEPGFIILPEVRIPGGLWLVVSVRISRQKHCVALLDETGKVIKPSPDTINAGMSDDLVIPSGHEIILTTFEGGLTDFSDTSTEDGMIEAFEQGRFAAS